MCSALKMGLFLHTAGSIPPTESAAERVRMSRQKQGFSPHARGFLPSKVATREVKPADRGLA